MSKSSLLRDIVNIEALQDIFVSFNALSGVPVTLTDLNGNLIYSYEGELLAAGVSKACSHYHRRNKVTNKNCKISDSYLSTHLNNGNGYAIYSCLNGLVDVAVPVYINQVHVANLFSGQFFRQKPDLSHYRNMAIQYGFDVKDYIACIKAIKVHDDDKIKSIITFLKSLSSLISDKLEYTRLADLDAHHINSIVKEKNKREEIVTTTLLSLNDYIYTLDQNDCFENYCTIFRIGLFEDNYDEIKGKHYSFVPLSTTIKESLKSSLYKAKNTRRPCHFSFSFIRNNKTCHFKTTVACRRDAMGQFAGTTLHIRDITDEVKAYEENQKLLHIINQSPVAIVITDKEANIEYANQYFYTNTGYSTNEVKGVNPRILKSGKTPPATYRELWACINKGKTWKGKFQNKRKDGSLFWEECVISPIINNGLITHFVAIKEDITERMAMEKELLKYKKRLEELVVERTKLLEKTKHDYKDMVEHLAGIVWEVNMQGIIQFVSPNIIDYSDYKVSDLINKPISKLFNPELHGKLYDFIKEFPITPHEFSDFEVFLDKEDVRTFLKASGKPIYNENGALTGIRGISVNYTQQKERDKQILTAIWEAEERQRTRISMELHDSIGATMSAISMYMNALNTNYPNDSLLKKADEIIKQTAQEIRLVARELKPPELETLGLIGSLDAIRLLYIDLENLDIRFTTNKLNKQHKKEIELALYRIISELINNSIKHGLANKIKANLFDYEQCIYLLYEDNGIGNFSVDKVDDTCGNGIKNIITRVKTLGGDCHFMPIVNCGLIVGLQIKY